MGLKHILNVTWYKWFNKARGVGMFFNKGETTRKKWLNDYTKINEVSGMFESYYWNRRK